MLRVKNMHFGSPSDLQGPLGEAKLSYVHYIIRRGEAKLCILKLTSVFHCLPNVGPTHLCALAHLGFTRKVGTSYSLLSHFIMAQSNRFLCRAYLVNFMYVPLHHGCLFIPYKFLKLIRENCS